MQAFAATLRAPARRAAFPAARRFPTSSFRQSLRKYSTEPNGPKSSNNTLIFGGVGAVVAGGILYTIFSGDTAETTAKSAAQSVKAATKFVPTKEDYQKVYNKVAEIFDEAGDYDDGSFAPVIFRLAWHSSGTYDKVSKTGGSNYATMRFEPESLHGANAGLHVARGLMENIKKEFDWISYGDLWTLGGVAAIQEMSGPRIPWRPGRIDGTVANVTPDGRLPDGAQGSKHLRDIFYRMGFNDQEIVALSGAHAVGRCHSDRSGFDGPWTFSPITVTNDYFQLLLNEKWVWKKWNGPAQYADKSTGTLMMLPTDYALVQDKGMKKYVEAYAKDQDLFFKDFAAVIVKLFEQGVPQSQFVTSEYWEMKTLDEQKESKK